MSCDGAKSSLVCRDGTWAALPCNGAGGCIHSGDTVTCDLTLGQVGDPCRVAGELANACSLDGTKSLTCEGGRFVASADCAGVDKCRVQGATAVCDQSTAALDAVCLREGNLACLSDGTKLLKCAAGKFAIQEECTGGTTCKVVDNAVGCL